ncbi:VOC family protein [Actinoplanes sp. TBRC 11911]|uniref:VOC family protein n=1 Tax=Actinoplanes sp. TBRC 11911 TaxID=2729386 RepID=UPI00145E7AE7|nr:VOC family protein [Actinoplanes sp. TBRC 11911]NMO50109.1 VOC family protein [Actinoplanes sp. TBRC 11911]
MDLSLEVVVISVSDVDRSIGFYRDQAGFRLDVDYGPNSKYRVVQLTPPGSSCSLQFGVGLDAAPPGIAGLCLVVADVEEARRELVARGVAVGPIRHKASADWQGDYAPGLDPDRRDYASFADFEDPDGNRWTLQERGFPARA